MMGTEYFVVVLRSTFFSKKFNFLFFVLNDFILSVLLILITLCSNILANVLPKLIKKSSLHSRSLDVRLLKFLLFPNQWECRIFISLSCLSLLLRNCPLISGNFWITWLCITLLIKPRLVVVRCNFDVNFFYSIIFSGNACR